MRLVSALKSAIALAAGLVITFAQNHSSIAGLWVLASYCASLAIALLIASFKASIAEALILLLIGSFAFLLTSSNVQLQGFGWLVASLTLSLTIVNVFQASTLGFKSKPARDVIITAALNLIIGLLYLLAPLDDVASVGFFGAYLILLAVHLGISAASPVAASSAK